MTWENEPEGVRPMCVGVEDNQVGGAGEFSIDWFLVVTIVVVLVAWVVMGFLLLAMVRGWV